MRYFSFSFSSPDTSSELPNLEPFSRLDDEQGVDIDKRAKNNLNNSVANIYNETQHNKLTSGSMRKRGIKYDDSQAVGKYHTIDTGEWEEIGCSVMDDNRIYVGRYHKKVDATVYIQVEPEGRTDLCNNYMLFHKKDWIEYRKERGEKKYQEPEVSGNGLIWIGNTKEIEISGILKKIHGFKVFVKKAVQIDNN